MSDLSAFEQPLLPHLSDSQFERVRDLLATYAGVYLDRTNQRGVAAALRQRMQATGKGLESYLSHIAHARGRSELHTFAELLLNHETMFFRNQAHMAALRDIILPYLHRTKPAGAPIRIWSAGCSTGEEPYSLAILAAECIGLPLVRPVQIYGTDLSSAALHKARRARYRGRALHNVEPELRQRYFVRHEDGWQVREPIRTLVTLEQLNLLEPFPPWTSELDIIFCQNVTIYFSLETFRQLAERFFHTLPSGGMLFLGFSETLWNVFNGFQLHEVGGAFVYVKGNLPIAQRRSPSGRLLDPLAPHVAATASTPSRPIVPPASASPRRTPPTSPQREATVPPPPPASPTAPLRTPRTAPVPPAAPPPLTPPIAAPDPAALVQQGRAWLDAGAIEPVLDLHRHVATSGAAAPQLLALIARAHANRGDIDLAIVEARRALELDSLVSDAYHLLGVLYLQRGEVSASIQHLERARYLEPEMPLISFHLAEAYRAALRPSTALREYRATLHKLAPLAADTVLDGVAVSWLRATCERQISQLT